MSDEAIVEVVTDNGGEKEFKRALAYRNGEPRRKRTVLICVLLIVAVIVPALLFGPPTQEVIVASTSVFSVPTVSPTETKLDLPQYQRAEDLRAHEAAAKVRGHGGSGGKLAKLLPPQLLKRPRVVKIPPGSMVKAQLITGASNGLVKAEIKEALVVSGETLVDPGTVAVGSGTSTDNRLFIKFDRLVYRDGTMDSVQAEAADSSDKTVGLKGSKLGYHALRLAAGIGLNFAGGLAEGLQETQGQQGVLVKTPSLKNALLNGAAHAALDQSRETMSSLKNDPPVIEVPEASVFYLVFSGSGE